MMESEGCSAVIKIPKYKRRRVSAVRTFPPGCGPSTANIRVNAGEDYSVRAANTCLEVENKTTLSSSGTNSAAAFPGAEKIKTQPDTQTQSPASVHTMLEAAEQGMQIEERSLENKKTSSAAAKSPCSSNGVEESVQVVLQAIEHELMMDEHSPDMSGELLPKSCHSSQALKVNAEYITKELLPEMQGKSRDVVEEKQEAMPILLNKDGKKISDQVEKIVAIDKLPPLNATSPTDACKDRNYPPRRRVSAIRDFPPGCGTNPSYSSERQYKMAELQRSRFVEREKTKAVYERKMEKGASEASDRGKAVAYRNDKEDKKGYSGNDTSLQAKHKGIQQVPIGAAANIRRQQGIATSSHVTVKQVRFRLKALCYEPKKDNEQKRTVVGTGKVLRCDAMNSSETDSKQKHLPPTGASSLTDAIAHNKVRETLRLFQALTRKFMPREEPGSKEQKYIRRADLHALSIFKEKGLYRNGGNPIIGHIPGVEVGAEFHYRVELMIIGLHLPSQGGIGCTKEGERSLATSVVDSGGYDNRVDDYDVWTYTGHGGNLNARDKAPEDQKLERGNLALKNSVKAKNLVRVIRGVKDTNCPEVKSKVSTKYTYYGVYTVERYWQEIGAHGIKEYKFELKRVSGQRELPWKVVKSYKKLKVKEGLCVSDISGGKEKFPICAVNTIDGEKPPPFTYTPRMVYPSYKPLRSRGCDCRKGCSNSMECSCVAKNGGSIPYNLDGAIVEAKPVVYECGPWCKCPASCYNRVSQLGISFQLEIFKTESRGWGVRSLSSIPSGGFVCEYTGELLEDKEAEKRTGKDEYLFDIGQNRNDHSIWDGLSGLLPPAAASASPEVEQGSGFTIDAAEYGNVGRFINHSCSPNLYAQNVLYDHGDTRVPHIMLFAAENIPPLQELTYHYNYKLNQVCDQNGNVKVKLCYCASPDCCGRLY